MSLLTDEIKAQVKESLAELTSPVKLLVFTQTLECQFCQQTRELLEDISELSDQITTEVYNFIVDADKAQEYGIDKIPAVAVVGEKDYGIRFYGIPAGYEFTTLIHVLRMVGGVGSQLDQATIDELAKLSEPVHMQVFVTPTCPYCPQAVVLAYELAFASEMVTADGVESSEFPQLAVKYQVAGVPRTVINESTYLEGAAPLPMVMEKVQEALG
jgi:glutaredoxin-like protein